MKKIIRNIVVLFNNVRCNKNSINLISVSTVNHIGILLLRFKRASEDIIKIKSAVTSKNFLKETQPLFFLQFSHL